MRGLIENRVKDIGDLDATKTAVVAMHWQRDIVESSPFGQMFSPIVRETGVVQRTAQVLKAARAAGAPVIYTNIEFKPGHEGLPRNNALFNTAVTSGCSYAACPGRKSSIS